MLRGGSEVFIRAPDNIGRMLSQDVTAQLAHVQRQLEETRGELHVAQQEEGACKARLSAARGELHACRSRLDRSRRQLRTAQQQVEDAVAAVEEEADEAGDGAQEQALRAEIERQERSVAGTTSQLEEVNAQLGALQARLQELHSTHMSFDEEALVQRSAQLSAQLEERAELVERREQERIMLLQRCEALVQAAEAARAELENAERYLAVRGRGRCRASPCSARG